MKVNGVDVFHPSTGEVRSDGPDGIACWFVDTEYNEESFFVRQAEAVRPPGIERGEEPELGDADVLGFIDHDEVERRGDSTAVPACQDVEEPRCRSQSLRS